MKKIKLRIGDIFLKDRFPNNEKSFGLVTFINERAATIKFDDDIILAYPLELEIDAENNVIGYTWNKSHVCLIARGSNDRIKKKKG